MQIFLRVAVSLLLAWQASQAVLRMVGTAGAHADVTFRESLLATTDERLRRALGDDADILLAMREVATPDSLWLTQKVTGLIEDIETPADFERLSARNGLLVQLTTLLYPEPFLLAVPDPVAAVEGLVRRGHAAELCVFPWSRPPARREGWRRLRRNRHFELWSYQKG